MTKYWVKTPQWLKKFFPRQIIWDIPTGNEPTVYLTFDDGPHPTATPFVLNELAKHNSKATFFCVGNNVTLHPEVYDKIISDGHVTGNHTHDHINGWHSDNFVYLKNIAAAAKVIENKIFRPPYGRIKISQARKLLNAHHTWKIYMWDVLSGDFDRTITAQQCLDNVLANIEPGSIVVFHDSEKAFERMSYALPRVLNYCETQGWKVKALPR